MATSSQAQGDRQLPSDQKAGSVLIFPYYNSTVGGAVDTRMTITNTSTTDFVYIHLFLLDSSCSQADMFMCLTPFGQFSLRASELDPTIKGYMIAAAVSGRDGGLIQHNYLIGNAFVRDGDYIGNYGAEAFWRYNYADPEDTTINYGTEYDGAPNSFWAEIQSPVDATQRLIHVGIAGNVSTGISGAALSNGLVYNKDEILKSWVLSGGGCFRDLLINDATFRTAPRLSVHIPTGSGGTMFYNIANGSVGLLMTANKNGQVPANWSGIRTVHKRSWTTTTLTIPIYIPTC
jgi:hypothetical protein